MLAPLLHRLLENYLDTRNHPVAGNRAEALGDLLVALERQAQDGYAAASAPGTQALTLDGARVLTEGTPCAGELDLVGAFFVLERDGHRMLPFRARLSLSPGVVSTIDLADARSGFAMPQSEREFARGVRAARWRHSLPLRRA